MSSSSSVVKTATTSKLLGKLKASSSSAIKTSQTSSHKSVHLENN